MESATCQVILLNLESEFAQLFAQDPQLENSSSVERITTKRALTYGESQNQLDISNFMKVTRVPSDPTSSNFKEGVRRQRLFYNIAQKLLYRLQDSINQSIAQLPSPEFSQLKGQQPQPSKLQSPRKIVNELLPTPKNARGHRRFVPPHS